MIIIIKKDGQIVTDDGNPIEGKALEGAYMLLADAQDGDSIVYDGTNHMWKAGSGGGGSFAPDITDPQDGDTLVYNATQQKWVNGAGAGGVLVLTPTIGEAQVTFDATYAEVKAAMKAGRPVVTTLPGFETWESGQMFIAASYADAADPAQGGYYEVVLYSGPADDLHIIADTEDGELYMPLNGD